MRSILAITGCVALSACSAADIENFRTGIESVDIAGETRRAFSETFQDQPFDRGTVYVVAEEHGDLHTYSLRPCGGDHICGGSGRVGHVERGENFYVVTGAYPHRTFYLSPGGDGVLKWRGVNRDLAWN